MSKTDPNRLPDHFRRNIAWPDPTWWDTFKMRLWNRLAPLLPWGIALELAVRLRIWQVSAWGLFWAESSRYFYFRAPLPVPRSFREGLDRVFERTVQMCAVEWQSPCVRNRMEGREPHQVIWTHDPVPWGSLNDMPMGMVHSDRFRIHFGSPLRRESLARQITLLALWCCQVSWGRPDCTHRATSLPVLKWVDRMAVPQVVKWLVDNG